MTVTNSSVDTIPADADVVVCQRVLADRAAKCAPQAQLVTLDNFLADPHLDALYNALTSTTPALDAKAEAAANEEIVSDLRNAAVAPLAAAVTEASKANGSVMKIQAEDIQLGLPSVTKEEAIRAAVRCWQSGAMWMTVTPMPWWSAKAGEHLYGHGRSHSPRHQPEEGHR